MPRKTAGKLQSPKARAASVRNLAKWEELQAYRNRVSDNWYLAIVFLVMGFALGLLAKS